MTRSPAHEATEPEFPRVPVFCVGCTNFGLAAAKLDVNPLAFVEVDTADPEGERFLCKACLLRVLEL